MLRNKDKKKESQDLPLHETHTKPVVPLYANPMNPPYHADDTGTN